MNKLQKSQERALRWIASQYGIVRLDGDILRAVKENPPGSGRYPMKQSSAVPAFHLLLDGLLLVDEKKHLCISSKGRRAIEFLQKKESRESNPAQGGQFKLVARGCKEL